MCIESMNKQFAIDDQLKIIQGNNGIPFIHIKNNNASAIISLLGAHVISYTPTSDSNEINNDLLFLSPTSSYEIGKAIRGGIPLCWPWFGDDPENLGRQAHGFARNVLWEISETSSSERETEILLQLKSSNQSKKLWPHDFILSLKINVSETLKLSLNTLNTGKNAFTISQALHTYFSVDDIKNTHIEGLNNISYYDKVLADKSSSKDNYPLAKQQGDLYIDQEVDRIYEDAPTNLRVHVKKSNEKNRVINIQSSGSKTAVVWNPWKAISIEKNDFTDDAYQQFICVETVNTRRDSVCLKPNQDHTIEAIYAFA